MWWLSVALATTAQAVWLFPGAAPLEYDIGARIPVTVTDLTSFQTQVRRIRAHRQRDRSL